MNENPSFPYHPRLHLFALATSGCTFLLLLAGALVTSTGSSLSVPDWPLSFGTFFPPMRGGVLFEHGHRLVAGTVSLLMTGLALYAWKVEPRRWVRTTAWCALGAVVLQAVLGGVTVLLHLPTAVSVAHAGLAQVFFCLTVVLAWVTSRHWLGTLPAGRGNAGPVPARLALTATVLVYLQVLVGAVARHSGSGLAIPDFPLSFGSWLPPEWTFRVFIQFAHTRLGALSVLSLVTWVSWKVCRDHPDDPALFWPAAAAGLGVWLQCFLGILVVAAHKAVVPTSFHLLLGAGVLASMLAVTLESFRRPPGFTRGINAASLEPE